MIAFGPSGWRGIIAEDFTFTAVRAVSQAELRIREAAKMGFKRCLLPERNIAKIEPVDGIELIGINEVGDALDVVLA